MADTPGTARTPLELRGGTAVITGAASGIGAALARRAAAEGMNVVVADIDLHAAQAAAAQLSNSGAEAFAVRVDVGDPVSVEALAAASYERFGDVRLLCNNAGIELSGKIWEYDVGQWERLMRVNLFGVFHGIHAFVPRMLASGGRAHIVNTSSVAALFTRPYTAAYGASKHAIVALTQSLAQELAAETEMLAVSALLPGPVATNVFDRAQAAGSFGEQYREAFALRLAADGISPDAAAAITFEGVLAGKLLIHTDLAFSKASIEDRAAVLRASIDS
ncbi:SDR family NAD(P)-dependent oxidoreductase [Microbacterium sp. BWT-B31]|uniref:SDR family NAD(P)-dependent oxidoreductase n=1 Tax=Microbacterium sp. BWT-B31 TaxID=3232072 RepID=UPI003527EBFC